MYNDFTRCWYLLFYKRKLTDDLFKEWFTTFAPKGKAPAAGEIWYAPNHGTTLQEIADSYGESFYRGELAERFHQFSKQTGIRLAYFFK